MKKIRLLALLVLGFVATTAMAQNLRVSGVVKSSEDGTTQPGVTIIVKGTTNGTGTNGEGAYTLNNVPSNGVLEFRNTGMKPIDVQVNGKTTINVTMQPSTVEAKKVTVTALGVRKQNRALGYAATTVGGGEISRTNTISPINALVGKVAGVNIATSSSGGVTTSPSITIRGAKSLTKNNSPIFVIDGIVMQNEEQDRGSHGSSESSLFGNQLKNLNPEDYESITVLKGAAATSLYGSRGANGAIVITTKRGKARTGLGIEVSYTHEFQQVYAPPVKLQNEFGMGRGYNNYDGDYVDAWQSTASEMVNNSFGLPMDGRLMKQYYKGSEVGAEPLNAQPDNWKAMFQTGSYDNVSAAITGGSENVTYRLSYAYTASKGALKNNSFNRHSINFNTSGKINDVLSVDASVQYTKSNATNPQFSSPDAWGWSPTMLLSYYMPRNVDLQWVYDNYIDPKTYERRSLGIASQVLDYINEKTDNNKLREEQTIIARLQLNANFTEWLDASVSVSYNDYRTFTENKNYGSGKFRAGGLYSISGGTSGQYNGLAQVHFNKRFLDDRFEVDARVLGEVYGNTRSTSMSKSTRGGLKVPGIFSFANSVEALKPEDVNASTGPRNNMTIGLAALVNLSWADQIYLELTARNDWVSSLTYPTWLAAGANNYSVFYPSANASWVFSETFKIDPNILSFGKIRASIAQVGMGTNPYETARGAGGYSVNSDTQDPSGNGILAASPNNGTLPNLDLKPEIQQSIEFGADLRFLNDRLGLDVTYYKTNTYNQIMRLNSPSESGVGERLINAGNIQNQGWEIQLDATPIQTRDWRWTVSANWTRNRGKVIDLHPDVKQYQFMGWTSGGGPMIYAFEGGAFGEIVAGNGFSTSTDPTAIQRDPNKAHYGKKLLKYGGVRGSDPAPLPYYPYVTTGEVSGYYSDDYKYDVLGNVQPDFTWGFNTSLTWKGFNLFVQIDGRQGGSIVSNVTRYAHIIGATASSLPGRNAEHGGLARVNYKGETKYDGMVADGVFIEDKGKSTVKNWKTGEDTYIGGMTMQEAVNQNIIQPMQTNLYYNYMYNNAENYVYNMDYVALREVSVGYNFPEKWIKHVGMQALRLQFSMRNLCYIYNGLFAGANPESISNNNPLTPYDVSGAPFTRNFSLSLNVRF